MSEGVASGPGIAAASPEQPLVSVIVAARNNAPTLVGRPHGANKAVARSESAGRTHVLDGFQ